MQRGPHHPWKRFAELDDWTLEWEHLPDGMMGLTCHVTKTVTLAKGMDQAERRCTIAHETEHILRGPVPPHRELQEELLVDRRVARVLLPSMRDLVDAMVWAHGHLEPAAAELWVDPFLLEVRLSALHARERDYVHRRLDEVLL